MKRGRIGTEFIFWIFRIFVIMVVVFGIVIVVSTLFGKKYDTRAAEGGIMAEKIIECFEKKGAREDVLASCVKIDEAEIYVGIENEKNFSIGNKDIKVLCELSALIFCHDYIYVYNNKSLRIKIGIKKIEKNV